MGSFIEVRGEGEQGLSLGGSKACQRSLTDKENQEEGTCIGTEAQILRGFTSNLHCVHLPGRMERASGKMHS